MLITKYILCHGSGNRFLMLDAVAEPQLEQLAEQPQLVAQLCREVGETDGLLLTVRVGTEFGMRMFNTDGSEAEMCGNGIRCVARQAQPYVGNDVTEFALWSGGVRHEVCREEPIHGSIPTYRVAIGVRLATPDFTPSMGREGGFIGEVIPELDEELRFTYINLGNPHLVAAVEAIDTERLSRLGERVKSLPQILPHGTNVSLYRPMGGNAIYTATYERGVGLTASCGTAMTASTTAACLCGYCRAGESVEVYNSGGMVRCCAYEEPTRVTTLSGNATYESVGVIAIDFVQGSYMEIAPALPCFEEQAAYSAFVEDIKNRKS
ncbi:MAG: diaminopimelate epimerase [Rikenellaceae bacterium]|nr:diaminopimelate epimerase [Rikenellaceae bacterium]